MLGHPVTEWTLPSASSKVSTYFLPLMEKSACRRIQNYCLIILPEGMQCILCTLFHENATYVVRTLDSKKFNRHNAHLWVGVSDALWPKSINFANLLSLNSKSYNNETNCIQKFHVSTLLCDYSRFLNLQEVFLN